MKDEKKFLQNVSHEISRVTRETPFSLQNKYVYPLRRASELGLYIEDIWEFKTVDYPSYREIKIKCILYS